ncbi:MAG: hypothetical protein SynsKO_07740 [Synoicihabitans sp.]
MAGANWLQPTRRYSFLRGSEEIEVAGQEIPISAIAQVKFDLPLMTGPVKGSLGSGKGVSFQKPREF